MKKGAESSTSIVFACGFVKGGGEGGEGLIYGECNSELSFPVEWRGG